MIYTKCIPFTIMNKYGHYSNFYYIVEIKETNYNIGVYLAIILGKIIIYILSEWELIDLVIMKIS